MSLAVCAVALVFLATCTTSDLLCDMQSCSTGSPKSYKVCASMSAQRSTYTFGGESCPCPQNDQAQCQACANLLAAFCGDAGGTAGASGSGTAGATGGGAAGATGSAGAGGTGSAGAGACQATFSGGVTGTVSGCTVNVTYIAALDNWTIAAGEQVIPGTSDLWEGFDMSYAGKPLTATYDQTTSLGSSTQLTVQNAADVPIWIAAFGQGQAIGSARVTFTSLGTLVDDGHGDGSFQGAHGTFTATLPDQNLDTNKPDVTLTVTF